MTELEPEWDDKQRAWALALLSVEAEACPGCGEPLTESTHPDAEGGYEVDDPVRCHACTELSRARAVERLHPSALFFEAKRAW